MPQLPTIRIGTDFFRHLPTASKHATGATLLSCFSAVLLNLPGPRLSGAVGTRPSQPEKNRMSYVWFVYELNIGTIFSSIQYLYDFICIYIPFSAMMNHHFGSHVWIWALPAPARFWSSSVTAMGKTSEPTRWFFAWKNGGVSSSFCWFLLVDGWMIEYDSKGLEYHGSC